MNLRHPRSIIAGQSALMRLDGWTWEDMTVRARVGLHVYWPLMPVNRGPLIVTDGDPLEIPTQVLHAFIDGAQIQLHSRHTQLYDKYRQRYGK